jgi:uncharacterized protein (TIGR03437 family)
MKRAVLMLLAATLHGQAPVNTLVATSAANFERGLPPPGSLASLFCTGFDAPAGIASASQIPLPLTLGGVSVTIDGRPAPIFAVANFGAYQQINVQVPAEVVAPIVRVQTAAQNLTTTLDFRTSPGDFFTNADGSGVFQHASDYSLVTPQHPAQAGEPIIAYLTGVASNGLVHTNLAAPFDPLAKVPQYVTSAGANTYTVSVGGVSVTPGYFGLAPGQLGVFQLNFVVPPGVAHSVPVALVHYTCSGNFHGTCGVNNGNPATATSTAVTIPVE